MNNILAPSLRRFLALFGRIPTKFSRFAGTAVVGVSGLLGVVAATALTPGEVYDTTHNGVVTRKVVQTLAQPTLIALTAATPSDLPFVVEERIRRGDTIQSLFRRMNIRDEAALDFITHHPDSVDALRRLRAGRSLTALVDHSGQVRSITLPASSRDSAPLLVERQGDNFRVAQQNAIQAETLVEMRSGVITHSLFGAADAVGMPDRITTKLAEIFGTEIDFSRDLRKGDKFSVVYEVEYRNGAAARTGKILAAEFTNQGKKHTLLLYREADGNETYYTPDGKGKNQAFLRYPLEFTRVSSSFGYRKHPIKGEWKHHTGTDFAAPRGTPVMASSDGVVKIVGQQRGYGNVIYLNHRSGYTTIYGHLNGFASGLKQGQRIRQGQVIGYVGMTGWATGPHLHYEVRVNNVPQDPMKIALPAVQPMGKAELAAFRKATAPMLERLAMLNYQGGSNLAANGDSAKVVAAD